MLTKLYIITQANPSHTENWEIFTLLRTLACHSTVESFTSCQDRKKLYFKSVQESPPVAWSFRISNFSLSLNLRLSSCPDRLTKNFWFDNFFVAQSNKDWWCYFRLVFNIWILFLPQWSSLKPKLIFFCWALLNFVCAVLVTGYYFS